MVAHQPMVEDRTWSIGDLAAEHATTLRTIRFYEDSGLLAPERRGQRRVYRARDRVRLQLILRGRRLGFSLTEIATILDLYDAEPGESGQLDYLLGQIDDRRRDLEQRRSDLEQTLAELDDLERRCRADLDRLRHPSSDPVHPPTIDTATTDTATTDIAVNDDSDRSVAPDPAGVRPRTGPG